MDIRKYMGISSISQKMKKSRKSREAKTPVMAACKSRIQAKYSRTRMFIFQDMSITRKPIRAERMTKGRLKPSTPTW
jgi:hypothetical protein